MNACESLFSGKNMFSENEDSYRTFKKFIDSCKNMCGPYLAGAKRVRSQNRQHAFFFNAVLR